MKELALLYALVPLAVGVVSRMGTLPTDSALRALATGAIYLSVPSLFAVMVLGVTQMPWAGWIAFSLESFLLGMLALSDALLLHQFTLRTAITLAGLGYALVRQRAWARSRAVSSLVSVAG